jgi:PAS domain S-box-containing protein
VDRDDLDKFFDLSLDCMAVAGFDGFLKRVNPAWTRTLGWTAEELMARPSIELVHPDDRPATLAAREDLKDGTPLTRFTNRYRCKDGTYRWFDWRSVTYADRGLVYAVARDVTAEREALEERQRIQAQLLTSERLAGIGRLAAGVAHEINNPLAFVTANLNSALREVRAHSEVEAEDSEALAQLLTEARDGAERIGQIVRSLGTFARAGEDRRALVEVQPVMQLCLNLVHSELRRNARLVEAYGPTPVVEVDEARLSEVFMNLLVNAAQAIAPGNPEANEIRIETSTDASGRAAIDISDTGRGIPPRDLARIFDPFFTTRAGGSGLGLSICHNLVTAMNGEVTVRSQEGRGSTFRVLLPAATEAEL